MPENSIELTNPENNLGSEKKYKIVQKFKECLDELCLPCAFLVFGSIGRGEAHPKSDIDCMIIFKDENSEKFLNNDFLKQLPFDTNESTRKEVIDDADKKDLLDKKLDFLRIKGTSDSEKIELQLFPFSSIEKATNIFGGDLTAGTKNLSQEYKIEQANKPRPTLTFKGKIVSFYKNPRLAESGRRIDINEAGVKDSPEGWIRGLTVGKLIAPKILKDSINFQEYLDRKVMRGLIKSILFNFDFYVRDTQGKVIGIKREALDYKILNKLLIDHRAILNEEKVYQFGKSETEDLEKRFDEQINYLITAHNYKIF